MVRIEIRDGTTATKEVEQGEEEGEGESSIVARGRGRRRIRIRIRTGTDSNTLSRIVIVIVITTGGTEIRTGINEETTGEEVAGEGAGIGMAAAGKIGGGNDRGSGTVGMGIGGLRSDSGLGRGREIETERTGVGEGTDGADSLRRNETTHPHNTNNSSFRRRLPSSVVLLYLLRVPPSPRVRKTGNRSLLAPLSCHHLNPPSPSPASSLLPSPPHPQVFVSLPARLPSPSFLPLLPRPLHLRRNLSTPRRSTLSTRRAGLRSLRSGEPCMVLFLPMTSLCRLLCRVWRSRCGHPSSSSSSGGKRGGIMLRGLGEKRRWRNLDSRVGVDWVFITHRYYDQP